MSHFQGKDVLEHLKEARKKGHLASKESHGVEPQGHLIGGADAARETALIILLLSLVHAPLIPFVVIGFFFWKVGRSAILGWSRLERINNLIEDEKREITTNRDEEKAELTAIYQAKGFSEPLLSKVIDVLMADDNKLLSIMLEEELGMSLESYEHPLKQAAGTGIGILLTVALFSLLTYFYTIPGLYAATFVTIAAASFFMAKLESVRPLNAIVWNLALTALAAASTFLLMRIL